MLMTLAVLADNSKATQLYEAADEAYAQQDYQQAVTLAKQALPLCKGTETEADCLNLLAITHIRLSNYDEAAKYAKECYVLDEKSGDFEQKSDGS